jgi:hypothetical protein
MHNSLSNLLLAVSLFAALAFHGGCAKNNRNSESVSGLHKELQPIKKYQL